MRLTASVAAITAGRRPRALRAFSYPGYPRLWCAALLLAFSVWMERLSIGWLVLDRTDSVFLSALSFAVSIAPSMVLGPLAGALVDRVERSRLLLTTTLVRASVVAGIAAVVAAPGEPVWLVLLLVSVTGSLRTFEIPATQALITDIVGSGESAHAVGLYSLGMRTVSVMGALTGGFIIEAMGAAPVFMLSTVLLLSASWVLSGLRVTRPRAAPVGSLLGDVMEGLAVMRRIPAVAVMLSLTMVVEVLAFSFASLLPAVAREVLEVDAGGLGMMTAAPGVGGILGVAALSTFGAGPRPGLFLLGVTFSFGVLLALFGANSTFVLALPLLAGVGAMAALFDALQWVLLQANVPDEMRGRVLGAWVWAIGFGWIGQLGLGAVGEAFGVQVALAGAGVLVVTAAILAALASRSLRAGASPAEPVPGD